MIKMPSIVLLTKNLEAKSHPKRKGLLSHVRARNRTGSWGAQSEPPAAGPGGEDVEPTGIFYTRCWGRKMCGVWKGFTLAIDKGLGKGEAGPVLG